MDTELAPVPTDPVLVELMRLHARLDVLDRRLERIDRQRRPLDELIEEVGPIGREVMRTAGERLADLERRGYFAFGTELLGVVDEVVRTTPPEDVRALAQSVGRILSTVRHLTSPEILALTDEAVRAVETPGEPMGILGMMKASQDAEVQRGFAVALQILRHLGKGTSVPSTHVSRLNARLAPRRAREERPAAPPPVPRTPPRTVPAPPSSDGPSCARPTPESVELGEWSRVIAERTARELGVELTAAHWQLIDFARAEFATTRVSPNIRRIAAGTGLSTREIYTLFPKAPGKTAARIAGIPKPAGCL